MGHPVTRDFSQGKVNKSHPAAEVPMSPFSSSLIVVPGGVALLEVLPPGGVEGADGAAQVAVVVRRGQVDLGVLVVGQHPREHRVLEGIRRV